jgi:hypothetical protein
MPPAKTAQTVIFSNNSRHCVNTEYGQMDWRGEEEEENEANGKLVIK